VHDISIDLTAVSEIDVIPTILEVVCRITGLSFAAVARVTADRWVADDGRTATPADARKPTAFGLKGMEERLRALGGTLELRARAGTGTDLIARVPLAAAVH
jgi:glucose-6-phosphate-specific signal transduction histidine kinase